MHEKRAAVCVSLVPPTAAQRLAPRRTVKAILFRSVDSEIAWILEVKRVHGFVKARLGAAEWQPRSGTNLPGWISGATATDGQLLGWIDVQAMVRDLAGTA